MSSLRDVLASALLLVATVLGALWLPAVWVADTIVSEDGFLAVTAPLADDEEFRTSITDSAVDALLDDDRVPDWLASSIEPVAKEQAARLAGTDAYSEIWASTMKNIHTGLLSPGPDEIVIDVAPAAASILDWVSDTVPLVDIQAPESLPITVAQLPAVGILEKAAVLDPWGARLGVIALVLVVLALLVAAHRRMALIGAGVGAILAGAIVGVLAWRIDDLVPNALDEADFVGPLIQVFEARFTADMGPQALVLAGAGAAVVVAGALALALLPRRSRA